MGENENIDEKEKIRRLKEEYLRKRDEDFRKKNERSKQLRAANKKRHADHQAASRKKSLENAKKIISSLREKLAECNWSQVKVADFSGIAPTTLTKIKRRRNNTARLTTITALARALGYKLVLVPLEQSEDDFYDERWVRKSSVKPKET